MIVAGLLAAMGLTVMCGCSADGIQPVASVQPVTTNRASGGGTVTTNCGICAFGLCFLGNDVIYSSPWTGQTTQFTGAGK